MTAYLFLQPLWRFRRAARIILHLCRFCLVIAKKARDMTPYSVDELLYFAAKASEEANRLGFNKDDYKRESSVWHFNGDTAVNVSQIVWITGATAYLGKRGAHENGR